jgi:hypothetical protein
MSTKWTPNDQVRELILHHGGQIRKWTAIALYDTTQFVLDENWWRLGITINKTCILFNPKILNYSIRTQAEDIFHELTHEAQYLDYGWVGFIGTYIGQWIRSGFSYDKMKNIGLEKEAIANATKFRNSFTGA